MNKSLFSGIMPIHNNAQHHYKQQHMRSHDQKSWNY